MDGQNNLLLSRRFFQSLNVPTLPDRGRQIVSHDAVFLALPDSSHEQDARPDAGAAQGASFGGVSYTKPGCAFGFEGERTFGCAVAVAIGLHHRADRHVRPDVLLHNAKILTQGGERNFRPGAAVKSERATIGQD